MLWIIKLWDESRGLTHLKWHNLLKKFCIESHFEWKRRNYYIFFHNHFELPVIILNTKILTYGDLLSTQFKNSNRCIRSRKEQNWSPKLQKIRCKEVIWFWEWRHSHHFEVIIITVIDTHVSYEKFQFKILANWTINHDRVSCIGW